MVVLVETQVEGYNNFRCHNMRLDLSTKIILK